MKFVLVIPVSHRDEAKASNLDINAQLGDFFLAQVVLDIDKQEGLVVFSTEASQGLRKHLYIIPTLAESMVKALKIRK